MITTYLRNFSSPLHWQRQGCVTHFDIHADDTDQVTPAGSFENGILTAHRWNGSGVYFSTRDGISDDEGCTFMCVVQRISPGDDPDLDKGGAVEVENGLRWNGPRENFSFWPSSLSFYLAEGMTWIRAAHVIFASPNPLLLFAMTFSGYSLHVAVLDMTNNVVLLDREDDLDQLMMGSLRNRTHFNFVSTASREGPAAMRIDWLWLGPAMPPVVLKRYVYQLQQEWQAKRQA